MSKTFSIIVRTHNSQDELPNLFSSFKGLGEYVKEIIVVDSGSTDGTISLAKRFKCKIIRISHEDFNAPYALNVGIEKAKGDYIGVLSPKACPVYKSFLKQALPYLNYEKVAGVYSFCLPSKQASPVERLIYASNSLRIHQQPKVIDRPVPGIMLTRNAFFPKKLWQEHRFSLGMNEGGEGVDWACYWLDQGYKFIWHPKLAVYYGRGDSLADFIKNYQIRRKVFEKIVKKY